MKILGCSIALFCSVLTAGSIATQNSLSTDVLDAEIITLPHATTPIALEPIALEIEQLKKILPENKTEQEQELRNTLLQEFGRSEKEKIIQSMTSRLNCSSEDLIKTNFLIGPQESRECSVRNLFATTAEVSSIYKTYLFAHPTYDAETLHTRANIIQHLIDNPVLLAKIESLFKVLAQVEKALCEKNFTTNKHLINDPLSSNEPFQLLAPNWFKTNYYAPLMKKINYCSPLLYFGIFAAHLYSLRSALPQTIQDKLQIDNPFYTEETGLSFDPLTIAKRLLNPVEKLRRGINEWVTLYQWKYSAKILRMSQDNKELIPEPTGKPFSIKDSTYMTHLNQLYGAQSLPVYIKKEAFPDKTPQEKNISFRMALVANLTTITLLTATDALLIYAYTTKQKEHIQNLRKLHTSVQTIEQMLITYKELQNDCLELSTINAECFSHSNDFLNMQKTIFPADASLAKDLSAWMLLIKEGALYKSSQRIEDNQAYLFDLLMDLGKLATYATIARTIIDVKKAGLPVCRVTFTGTNLPEIRAQNFWNPLVEKTQAVCNSIEISPTGTRNILLTGPNGSGKSTNTKGILLNILLAQTIGFAFAESFIFTPYTDFWAAFNEQENVAQGQSSFMAEKKRIETLRNNVLALPEDHRAFLFMDEPVKGTIEEVAGEKISAECLRMSEKTNCTILLVTHTAEPLKLEQLTNGAFTNYYVDVRENSDGETFTRTFKMLRGAAEWWFSNKATRTKFVNFLN